MTKEPTSIVADIKHIIDNGMRQAYTSASFTAVHTYWLVGRRIVEEEQDGSERATYGSNPLNRLAAELSIIYPKGYSARNLREYRQFYLYFSDLEIWHSRVPKHRKEKEV